MNKRKRHGKVLMMLGTLLVLSAVTLALYNSYTDTRAGQLSQNVLSALGEFETDPDFVPDYVLNPEMSLPVKEVDGREYVGTVEIPVLGLELPVLSEWSYLNFKIAPCVYEGTPYKNNFIIAAHNYRSHFAKLRTLTAGDEVSFTDVDGNRFDYEVMYVEILDNNAVRQMSEGEWDLTLFTCTYGGATRVTVRCRLK